MLGSILIRNHLGAYALFYHGVGFVLCVARVPRLLITFIVLPLRPRGSFAWLASITFVAPTYVHGVVCSFVAQKNQKALAFRFFGAVSSWLTESAAMSAIESRAESARSPLRPRSTPKNPTAKSFFHNIDNPCGSNSCRSATPCGSNFCRSATCRFATSGQKQSRPDSKVRPAL